MIAKLAHLLPRLVFALISAFLMLNFGLAWLYVSSLTHPPCIAPAANPAWWPPPEAVELTTHRNHNLEAWYYPSANKAVVIVLLGHSGALGLSTPNIGFLLEQGYGVLQIESRACADPPAVVTLGYHEAADAMAGLDHLSGRDEVDPNRLAVFGFSMGGVTAIRTAARDRRIAAVIAEGGFYNLGADFVNSSTSWWQTGLLYAVAGAYWMQTGINPWQVSPIEDLELISPRPVYLIYGEHEVVNGYGYQQFEAALAPKTLWVVPGGFHGGNQTIAKQEYEQRILDFLFAALFQP